MGYNMKEYELRRILYGYLEDICHYSQLQISVTSEQQKKYCQQKIEENITTCINTLIQTAEINMAMENMQTLEMEPEQPRQITAEELAYYDGTGGKPAYVAVNDIVYDVSDKLKWSGGTHFGLYAGKNLTSEFMGCHLGVMQILSSLPKVGVFIQD